MQSVLVVQSELNARVGTARNAGVGRLRDSDSQQLCLDVAGLRSLAGDFFQRRAGGSKSDGGDEALDDWAIGKHDGAVARVTAQLERQFRAEHRAAEIHEDDDTVGRGDAVDRFFHASGVGAEYVAIETGGNFDGRRCPADHLQCELDGGVGQTPAVRNDDDPDHHELTLRNTDAAASNSKAADVAPGSW